MSRISSHPTVANASQAKARKCAWNGCSSEARAPLVAALYQQHPQKVVLVTPTYERAIQWRARLQLCGIPESDLAQLPSGLSALFEDAAPETLALSDRIGALRFLVDPRPGIVITTPQAVLERTLPRDILESAQISVKKGDDLDIGQFTRSLSMLGYEPSEPVRAPGQYSRRGGIIDVFLMGADYPVRIELFGDTVDSLRTFDTNSQRSIGSVTHIRLSPSRETLYHFDGAADSAEIQQARMNLAGMVRHSLEVESAVLPDESGERLTELIEGDAKAIEQGVFFDRLDLYRPLMHPDSGCAIDLLPENGWLVLDDPGDIEGYALRAEDELALALDARKKRGEILDCLSTDFVINPDHLASFEASTAMTAVGAPPDWFKATETIEFDCVSLEPNRGRPETLAISLKTWLQDGYCVVLSTDQPNRAKAVLSPLDIFPADAVIDEGLPPGIYMAQGNLAGGFVSKSMQTVLLTDQELFGVGRLKLPQRKFNEGAPIHTVLDLKPGDYVVHINFGIGIFQGLTQRTIDGVDKEFLFIQYAGPDKLYVPTDQLDRVQKYLNPGDAEPKLNRIQGGEWQRTVGKAREEAREFARDLTRLYARRKQVQRQGYGPDSPWQSEMETTFPWSETASQMRAIKDTKQDLQLDYPMDRLICGDVGFGKTEVAIRAAFKVAQAGRQVAVLCPTTILSEQHYRNFAERLVAFPTRVDYLNRFRTAADRKEVIRMLESGDIDIVIGTHSLLAKDLKFKDLGLVVIDEEQKFGVKQKEALKELRVNVDVLTMSATPIPRTLSMALMDIRQMSLINDPPPGRLPIRTFVRAHSDEVIREAILRELSRGGQVYFVYNRVQGLYHIAERIKKLVPSARIGVGHGQMPEQELEPIMIAFIRGELDILVCTTIVESGLDIPNANTLIVENADRFGLSQLYQLRGRVGRSDRQAYAYFMHQGEQSLTENAMARLTSLQEFSSLGSGYSLAFRDLQIRGAGELLGAKQSGTMASVGYELFVQIIHEEVKFLKSHADGEGQSRVYNDPLEGLAPLPSADLPASAFIPENYINDQGQRLYYYKAIMSSRNEDELGEARQEIIDRYGILPPEVESAFLVMRMRMKARDLQMSKLDGHGGRIAVSFDEAADFPPRLWSLLQKRNKACYLTRGQFIWPFTGDVLAACDNMLETFQVTLDELESQRAALGLT